MALTTAGEIASTGKSLSASAPAEIAAKVEYQ